MDVKDLKVGVLVQSPASICICVQTYGTNEYYFRVLRKLREGVADAFGIDTFNQKKWIESLVVLGSGELCTELFGEL